ncbi:unnamed protein product [Scytosiphon promiscuus]
MTAAAHEGGVASSVTGKCKAELLGVHEAVYSAARQRAKALDTDVSPNIAIDQGTYWFAPRSKRSDATKPEVLSLMKTFWHTDEVSRATGKAGDTNMYRESKKKDAAFHPRRQLTLQGGGEAAFSKFFEWREYLNFKAVWKSERGEDFQDPGRTLFLSTRCKCLTSP